MFISDSKAIKANPGNLRQRFWVFFLFFFYQSQFWKHPVLVFSEAASSEGSAELAWVLPSLLGCRSLGREVQQPSRWVSSLTGDCCRHSQAASPHLPASQCLEKMHSSCLGPARGWRLPVLGSQHCHAAPALHSQLHSPCPQQGQAQPFPAVGSISHCFFQ